MSDELSVALRAVLRSDEAYELLPEGTWFSGGCWLLAKALSQWLPRFSVPMGIYDRWGTLHHVFLAVPTGQALDAGGRYKSVRGLVRAFKTRERVVVDTVKPVNLAVASKWFYEGGIGALRSSCPSPKPLLKLLERRLGHREDWPW